MKKIIFILLLGLIASGCLTTNSYAWFDKWTTEDTILQIGFSSLIVIDTLQTRYFLGLPKFYDEKYEYEHTEGNPILGNRPSALKLYSYNSICLVGHLIISYILPKPYRNLWQFCWISIQTEVVHHNYKGVGGLKLKF